MKENDKILIISPEVFYPPTNGFRVRYYNLFKNLASKYQIDLLTFADQKRIEQKENNSNKHCLPFSKIDFIPTQSKKNIAKKSPVQKFRNIFYPSELSMGDPYYSDIMAQRIDEKLTTEEYALLFFCNLMMYRYLDKRKCQVPYVIDVVDSVSLWMKSYFINERRFSKKITAYLNYIWTKRYEQVHLSKARDLVFITETDKNFTGKNCPRSRLWVLENGVDTEYYKPKPNIRTRKNSLIFTGVMEYKPNHEAAMYFINEILPLVKKKYPDVSLTIAGKYPSEELVSKASNIKNLELTGFVEDLRPYFDISSVYVAPIVSGAGMKNKILEAWAMSKPVITTSMGCSGLNAVDGENCLIADTPSAFAENINLILSDYSLRNEIAENGRKNAERYYSWKKKATLLEEILSKAICKDNLENEV